MSSRLRPFALSAVLLSATSALAQDATQDWDVNRDPEHKAITAYTEFSNGLGLAVRCVDGGYEAVILGLPSAEGERRVLQTAFRDQPLSASSWTVATNNQIAVSEAPAPFAREVRQGGRFQVMIPGAAPGGQNLRYTVDLPASNVAIDETLTACERPLIDPRDAETAALAEHNMPGGLNWRRPPRPSYPENSRYARGFAVVSCISNPDGTARSCVVETEHPLDGGFGRATLASMQGARLRSTEAGQVEVPQRRFMFRAVFHFDVGRMHRSRGISG